MSRQPSPDTERHGVSNRWSCTTLDSGVAHMNNVLNPDEDFNIQEEDLLRELEDHNEINMGLNGLMVVNYQEQTYVD